MVASAFGGIMEKYWLRPSVPEDKEKICQLKLDSIRQYVEPIWGWEEAYQRKDFQTDFQDIQKFFTIEIDNNFAGFLQVENGKKNHIHIEELHLCPAFRGKGVGTSILEMIKKECISRHKIAEIGCFKKNSGAKVLYTRMGFSEVEETNTHFLFRYPGWKVIPYEKSYRDDMIFMVLSAKDALGRIPGLNEDLLDVQQSYFDKGDFFWVALDSNNRVIGCVGYHCIPGTTEVKLQRLYIKPNLKRQGIGTWLLHTVEMHLIQQGKTAVWVHLGGKEYFESRSFYPKHGYEPVADRMLRKELLSENGIQMDE